MMPRFFWLLLTTATTFPFASSSQEEFCNCQYDLPLDGEPDCRVYGQLGDGNLIPWQRASQTCLDDLKIKIAAMDIDTLWSICPFSNHTNANLQLLMNEIRFNPSPASRAIQSFYPEFWVESNVTAGTYDFVNVIYDNRNSPVLCTQSEALCWGTVRDYFTLTPEATSTACKELHDRQKFDMDLEQSTVRIRLCFDGPTGTPASCEPLQSQVTEIKAANPASGCSAFGLGPASYASKLPQCESGQVAKSTPTSEAAAMTKSQLQFFPAGLVTSLLFQLLI